jgi:hypothetical protein
MNPTQLVSHQLESVWLSHPRVVPQSVWIDTKTPALQSCFVNLLITGLPVIHIVPTEVEIPGKHPALGVIVEEQQALPSEGYWYEGTQLGAIAAPEIAPYLPSAIVEAKIWDALGEGPDSALTLILANGVNLSIRHIYPPMLLGIEITNVYSKE